MFDFEFSIYKFAFEVLYLQILNITELTSEIEHSKSEII